MTDDPLDPPSRWISVKDGLPVEGDFALVAIDPAPDDPEAWSMEVAWFEGGKWHGGAGPINTDYATVTYWQPLPEPPEK